MKKKEFCNEIINQINYFLGEENKDIKLSDYKKEIINQLALTLTAYCNFEEYSNYVYKIKNQRAYISISLDYVLDFLKH